MIVVTGASKGLGRAICERLLSKKNSILGLARNIDGLCYPACVCDVGSYVEVKKVAKKIREERGRITALINAAGVASMNLALTTPSSSVQRIIQTNLIGTINCCQLLTAPMLINKEGVIINFSTIAVPLGLKGESVYVASKAGVEGFTRSFAREVSEYNVRVNCIAPGPIQTNLLKGITPEQIQKIVNQQIINRQFTPEAVCDLVEILLDSRTSSISGQVLHVGGV